MSTKSLAPKLRPVLKHRLPLGFLLILALIGLAMADQRLDGTPMPAPLARALGLSTFPPGTLIFLVVAGVSVLASRELAAIMRENGLRASKRITTAAALVGLGVSCLVPVGVSGSHGATIANTGAIAVFLFALLYYSRHRSFEGIVAAAGGTMLAYVYLGLMLGFVLAIRRDHDVWTLLWIVLVTKSSDIGAYFTGRLLGKHKLIVWLSPGKTWEGLVGGVALAGLIAATTGGLMLDIRPLPSLLILAGVGALLAVVGQFGDLIASLFKRDAGLKDSSRILPGFGGVLDVMDSPILVAPVAYWWLQGYSTGIAP
jgi:phosphatidate cytidylyltransferase